MKNFLAVIFSVLFLLANIGNAMAVEQDVRGGKDHPLLSRMPDFHISEYKESDFGSQKFIGQDKKQQTIEGHRYFIEYKLNKGTAEPGELKLRRNIQNALTKIGGKVVFDDNFNRVSTIVLQKGGRETWVEVRSYNNMYRISILEKGAMKQEVVANAAAMGNDISSTGHVPVYGIYFDTGKSEIKPESESTIAEIAKLLKNKGTLRIYIVGHTDNVGSFDSNMQLSKDRAAAVAKALSGKYGIASSRLRPHGVASLSPVASNDSEEGKAKNRRVELVKQ